LVADIEDLEHNTRRTYDISCPDEKEEHDNIRAKMSDNLRGNRKQGKLSRLATWKVPRSQRPNHFNKGRKPYHQVNHVTQNRTRGETKYHVTSIRDKSHKRPRSNRDPNTESRERQYKQRAHGDPNQHKEHTSSNTGVRRDHKPYTDANKEYTTKIGGKRDHRSYTEATGFQRRDKLTKREYERRWPGHTHGRRKPGNTRKRTHPLNQ
jgi:hypothetical protein